MSFDIRKLAEKAKVDYVIVAVFGELEPAMLYDKKGVKIAEGKHFEYLKFMRKAEEEEKRYALYFRKREEVIIHNRFGDEIWEGKINDLPQLNDKDFYEELPDVTEKVKNCKNILEAIKIRFKNNIIRPEIDVNEEFWKTKIIVKDNIVFFPEKNAWILDLRFEVPDQFGEEVTARLSENVFLSQAESGEYLFEEAEPKTLYIDFYYNPPANIRDRCKILNEFRAIAKYYRYRVKVYE